MECHLSHSQGSRGFNDIGQIYSEDDTSIKVGRSILRKPIKHLVTIHTMLDILVPFFLLEKGKAN